MTKKRRRLFKPTVVFLSAVFLIFVIFFASLNLARQLYPTKYSDFVESYTLEYNLQKSFVYAVIKCESGFDERAVSSVGAKGLMQIMPETFLWLQGKTGEELSEEMLFDAETNIKYGSLLYSGLIKNFGDVKTAVAAYHAGWGNVKKWLSDKRYSKDGKTLYDIPFPSTKHYVERVMKTQKIYEKLYNINQED